MSIHSQNQNHKILKNKFEFGPLDSQKLERQPTETDTKILCDSRGDFMYISLYFAIMSIKIHVH